MFLRSLTITSDDKVIRDIIFHNGLNLIIDETPKSKQIATGNNVGKTTVLKLIDFCLGSSPKNIYIDPETKKDEYLLVKDFLINKNVLITLILTTDLNDETANNIKIERNFLPRTKHIRKINGKNYTEDEFELKLNELIFPEHSSEKPTFRQIISHNIRYKDEHLNNTLKTLDKFTSDVEYEALYLYLFNCDYKDGNSKQAILGKINQEYTYKNRLEREQTKTAYESSLSLIEIEIERLNRQKSKLNINENFERDLAELSQLKYEINKSGSLINKLKIRRDTIIEAGNELSSDKTDIDISQLQLIYKQATDNINTIQKSFSDLVNYHNRMLDEKIKFITAELPTLEKNIAEHNLALRDLLAKEKELTALLATSDTFEELENLISELNENYRQKGEYENIIKQISEVESSIKNYNIDLELIDKQLFSEEFEQTVKNQVNKFNMYFSQISNALYGEKYAIKYDKVTNRKNQRLYKFSAFNTNLSSGKKQGEISCFDIAYTLFADSEEIPCLHFLLNDKKELMHHNQLLKISNLVIQHNIQFVASILKDKLPSELNNPDYFTVILSQEEKLFRIENQ
ncbi:MAG: DUF2326 domain-containing protein [Spirochaetia bacterium]|nr:DUF2326 domain-containing protein [Spirochaetia bacterium]